MTKSADTRALSGPELRALFAAGTAWLERNREAVNAINVFPVPDGDTGTNMFLTMRATMEEADRCRDDAAGAMMAAISHGALMGARGNSGVILSQILRGVAKALGGLDSVDSRGMAAGFEEGSAAAYRAVTKPVEGTILTVIREVAEATRASVNGTAPDVTGLFETAVSAAQASVARTPELLPVLAEAGVVDAGGQGLCVFLEGMLRHLKGEPLEAPVQAAAVVEHDFISSVEQRHVAEPSPYGYCAEVLVEGATMEVDAMRDRVLAMGDSVIVVGDENMVRIHVHTDDPGAVLTLGTSVGSLAMVKIDNINRQAERFVEMHSLPQIPVESAISCVAVASGEGLAEVFRSMGCSQVVSGGPTMNPSTRDIVDAIEAAPGDDVIVLPNDKNIILAAEQAVPLTKKRVRIVKSRSVPQGIAALLATNPEDSLDDNAAAMEEALPRVRTIEVTRAVRSVSLKGVAVKEGDVIAIVDDELTLAAGSPEDAVVEALRPLTGEGTAFVSLYYGAETTSDQAEALADSLRADFSGHEVEVVFGGQPHYSYIVSLE